MSKWINLGIYGLFLLSAWTILSVGIGWLPQFEISNLSELTCNQMNTVGLNLSYSYFAGFIFYTLTITIPQLKRRIINLPLIEKMVREYFSSISMDFFMFCVENNRLTLTEPVKDFMANYRTQMEKQFGEKMLRTLIERKNDADRYKSLVSFRESDTNFMNRIIPFEMYLTNRQVSILNEIRQHTISYAIDGYEDLVGISDIDNLVLKVLDEHVSLVKRLKDSI